MCEPYVIQSEIHWDLNVWTTLDAMRVVTWGNACCHLGFAACKMIYSMAISFCRKARTLQPAVP
jgi:hypothetical protein